eukprot:m51a1_g1364 hypothetical protein (542) ;mRNA; r:398810-402387
MGMTLEALTRKRHAEEEARRRSLALDSGVYEPDGTLKPAFLSHDAFVDDDVGGGIGDSDVSSSASDDDDADGHDERVARKRRRTAALPLPGGVSVSAPGVRAPAAGLRKGSKGAKEDREAAFECLLAARSSRSSWSPAVGAPPPVLQPARQPRSRRVRGDCGVDGEEEPAVPEAAEVPVQAQQQQQQQQPARIMHVKVGDVEARVLCAQPAMTTRELIAKAVRQLQPADEYEAAVANALLGDNERVADLTAPGEVVCLRPRPGSSLPSRVRTQLSTTARSIDLSGCAELDRPAVQDLIRALSTCSQLRSLDLGGARLRPEDAHEIAASCRAIASLEELSLSGTRVALNASPADLDALAGLPWAAPGLRSLRLTACNIPASFVARLRSAAESRGPCTLQMLDLSVNPVGQDPSALCSALAALASPALSELCLRQTFFSAPSPLQASFPRSLRCLSLSRNSALRGGVVHVVAALAECRSLAALCLGSCGLCAADGAAVLSALGGALPALRVLDLSGNQLGAGPGLPRPIPVAIQQMDFMDFSL